jgi:tetratricopeptide (TPR) repeat protein
LYRLRRALGHDWFSVEEERVGLQLEDLWVDVWEFEQRYATGDPVSLQSAVELYGGALLPELYDDWILPIHVSLEEKYLDSLLRLGRTAETHHEPQLAWTYYQKLVQADPLREEGQRGLMRSLARMDRHNEALTVYQRLEATLQQELGLPPSTDTQVLAELVQRELEQRQHAPLPFVGRTAERARLLACLNQARGGRGGLAVVLGEAGIGKTRLLEETARAAAWRGWQVVWGHTEEFNPPAPQGPLPQALMAALPEPRLDQITRLVHPAWLSELGGLIPRLNTITPPSVPETNMRLEREQEHSMLPMALRHLLHGLGQITPHLIILEDIQWGDSALWSTLEALRGSLSELPVLIIVSGRKEELRALSRIWETIEKWDQTGETVISLTGLMPKDLEELALAYHQAPLTAAERTRLITASAGNPLLALALLKTDDSKDLSERPSLLDLMVRRVTALGAQVRRALEAAAVLGYRFQYTHWEALLSNELTGKALARVAGELESAGLIMLEADSYRFVHETLRASVYTQATPKLRRQLHRQALHILSRYRVSDVLSLLTHAEQAQDCKATARYALQAGQQALSGESFETAVRYFSQALEALPPNDWSQRYRAVAGRWQALYVLADIEGQHQDLEILQQLAARLGDDERRLEVMHRQANLAWATGTIAQAQSIAQEGQELARQIGSASLEAAFLETLGRVSYNEGDHHQTQKWIQQAHDRFALAGDDLGMASTLDKLANLEFEFGNFETAVQQHTQAAKAFRKLGAVFRERRALNGLAMCMRKLGDYARAREIHERSLVIVQELGDKRSEWVELANLGNIAFELGDYGTAIDRYEAALAICRNIDEPRGISMMLNNRGFALGNAGRANPALSSFEEALEINRAKGYRRGEAHTQRGRGLLLMELEKYNQAFIALEAAQKLWTELDDRLNMIETLAGLGLIYIEQNGLRNAERCLKEALDQLDEERDQARLRQWVHYVAYRVHQAQGALATSYRHLRQAQAAMQSVANDLPPDMRERFLTHVPLNRKTEAALAELVRRQEVRLVRADVPLGRGLTERDYKVVHWTLYAPEDDAIAKKTERRRAVLQRLLREAEAQGAAPTDDDLAAALGVSRRTILRDMKVLAQTGIHLPTRRRQ